MIEKASWLIDRLLEMVKGTLTLQRDVRRLAQRVGELEQAHKLSSATARRADRTAMQVKLVAVLNRAQEQGIARVAELLDERRIGDHVRCAIASASFVTDPYEHIVVERVVPEDVYDLLLRAIPPAEFFEDRDRIKQTLTFPMEYGPALSAMVWGYF